MLQKEGQLDKADLPVIAISSAARKRRFLNPTNEKLSAKAKQQRCAETLSVYEAIHGGFKENINPVVTGMLSTLNSKCKSIQRILLSPQLCQSAVKSYKNNFISRK